MRFWVIKIIFLISIISYFSPAVYAKEYDFSFDLQKPKATQNPKAYSPTPSPSFNSWRVGMQASLLPNLLESSGELVYGNLGEHENLNFSDWNKYLLTLGVSGKWDNIGYGFNFYSVGQQYEGIFNSKYSHKKGRAGYDSWLSFNINKLQIKAKYLKSWTKASNKINHSQTFDSWYEIESSYPITSSPLTEVSVTYGLGDRSRFVTPNAIQTYQGSIDLFKTKFRFVADSFKFSTEIRQSRSKNDIGSRDNFRQNMLYFNSTLFPRQPFTIVSSFSYGIDSHSGTFYNNKLTKVGSSVGLAYRAIEIPVNLKLTSRYNNYRSDDKFTNKDKIKLAAQLNWKSIGSYTGLKSNWTVKCSYSKTIDHINPTSSFSDLSFNLQWQWPIS
jgi:hypothetical protein